MGGGGDDRGKDRTGDAPNTVSEVYDDYKPFVDWGKNPITNGGNEPNLWRTLNNEEWEYMFYSRENAISLFGLGSVNGVNGLIILPDDWWLPYGLSFTASAEKNLTRKNYSNVGFYDYNYGDNYVDNAYTLEQWAKMEKAGAVFLPAVGDRWDRIRYVGVSGSYWSSVIKNDVTAFSVDFETYYVDPSGWGTLYIGRSVRLVR